MRFGHIYLLAVAALPIACSILLKTNENQCSTDDDCVRRGGLMATAVCSNQVCVEAESSAGGSGTNAADAGTSPWSCLGKVVWPAASKPQVVVTILFYDLIAKKPVTNVTVRPCAKLDVTCASPLSAAVSPDAQGIAALTLPASFDGYAEVVSAAENPSVADILPLLVFFNPPPNEDLHYGTVPAFSIQGLAALAASQGNTVDPTLGFVFSGALDCYGKPAPGVSWEPDRTVDSTRRFYYVDGLPSEVAVATDATGYGGLINMPTGTIRLFAKLQATGQTVGQTSVFVRAGHLTTGFLVPTP